MAEALGPLNKGKAADIFGVTTEHLMFASKASMPVLAALVNIFKAGNMPRSLKLGLFTPVFKMKFSSLDVKNYRGITILTILSKLLELG